MPNAIRLKAPSVRINTATLIQTRAQPSSAAARDGLGYQPVAAPRTTRTAAGVLVNPTSTQLLERQSEPGHERKRCGRSLNRLRRRTSLHGRIIVVGRDSIGTLMTMTSMERWCNVVLIGLSLATTGCRPAAPLSSESSAPAAPQGHADFVDVVWKVAASPTVAVGTLYVFLSDGTLVITSPHSKPALGRWTRKAPTALTMIEEGVAYPVEILQLDREQFRVRVTNPGDPVEITFARGG